MTKNYMADVAKLLGVEPNEEFEVVIPDETEHQPIRYQFNSNQFGCWETEGGNSGFHVHWNLLLMILCGQAYIKKLPWKPKNDEKYYYVCWHYQPAAMLIIGYSTFSDISETECLRVDIGNCFKTYEEAEAAKHDVFKRLTGKDWHETYGKEGGNNAND